MKPKRNKKPKIKKQRIMGKQEFQEACQDNRKNKDTANDMSNERINGEKINDSAERYDECKNKIAENSENQPKKQRKNAKNFKGGVGIKWRIFGYFALFCVIMLIFLWLFQVVLLDDFYKSIKTHSVSLAGESISRAINEPGADAESVKDVIVEESQKYDICVMVIDSDGAITQTVEHSRYCIIHNLPYADLIGLTEAALSNGGTVIYKFYYDAQKGMMIGKDIQGFNGYKDENDGYRQAFGENSECIIYLHVTEDASGHRSAILINSAVTPIDATVQTLRWQLIIVMCIMIVLALILAVIMSKTISAPIVKISNASKELAEGNYDIDFTSKGFREIKELGESLNYAAGELGKTEKFQREIIANVSHDLRTPLTMITGYAEVMRDLPGENTPENVQVIIDEANRLTTLVNDALDLSKLQSGNQEPNMEKYNFTASVEEILQRFAKLKAEDGYDIEFEYDRVVWVCADEVKLSQVVYNLIINAITHAGEDKKVIVRQRVISRAKNKRSKDFVEPKAVRLEVIDHGEGIDPDQLDDIWQRYYKVDKTHKRAQMGTGLGLSIVRSVLEMHNARYGVESRVEEGSTFWFEIDLSLDWNKPTDHIIGK